MKCEGRAGGEETAKGRRSIGSAFCNAALLAIPGLAPATLSFHLKELTRTGLIAARHDGRFIWYRADFEVMNGLVGYLTENCCRATGESCCVPIPKPRIVARRKQETHA